jgi:hypothetical protein
VGAGIGAGSNGTAGTLSMNNNNGGALVFASSVSDMSSKASGVLVIGDAVHWYGSNTFTLIQDATIPASYALNIPSDKTLVIQNGRTLTINDALTINGALTNNGTISPTKGSTINVLGSFINNGMVTPTKGSTLSISGTLTNNGMVTSVDSSTINVSGMVANNKIIGANVSALFRIGTFPQKTPTSITLYPSSLQATTGQTVEYAFVNASNAVPTSGWQTSTTFDGLTPSTDYYFFARSAENANFTAGTISNSSPFCSVNADY